MVDKQLPDDISRLIGEFGAVEVKKQLKLGELNTGSSDLNEYLRDWKNTRPIDTSHMKRFLVSILNAKSMMAIRSEYICCAFKMTRLGVNGGVDAVDAGVDGGVNSAKIKPHPSSTVAIYAVLYSEFINGEIKHKYLSIGPTYSSQDGEYRHRFMVYEHYLSYINNPQYVEIAPIAESYILGEIESGVFTPHVDYFINPSIADTVETKLKKIIGDSRLCVNLFTTAWLEDYHRARLHLTENHINASYKQVVCSEDENSTRTYNALIEKVGADNLYTSVVYKYTFRQFNVFKPQIGVKIIPIRHQEAIDAKNIQYELWREWYLMRKCANLMLNFISPTFPYVYGWFSIKGVDARLFDNQAMYNKYVESEIADTISGQLSSADGYTKRDGIYINHRFHKLSDKIKDAEKYGDLAIRLTNNAFCMVQEHAYITLGDLHLNYKYMPHNENWLHDLFNNIDVFKKLIFEYIYGFYCLNSRLNVIHGDLHLNNATVYPLMNYYSKMLDITNKTLIADDKPYIMYAVHDDVFLFRQTGIVGTIIDLSRAVFGSRDTLVAEYDDVFADTFLRVQRTHIIRIMKHNYPDMMEKHGDAITKLIDDNFPLFFRIFSVVDILNLTRRYRFLLEAEEFPTSITHITEFLQRVEVAAEKIFLEKLDDAITGKIKKLEDMPWPNYTLMHKLFPEFALCKRQVITDLGKRFIADPSKYNVMDVFNQGAELNFNIDGIRSHPPYLNVGVIRDLIIPKLDKTKKEEVAVKEAKTTAVATLIENDRIERVYEW